MTTPVDAVGEIKRLYYSATRATIAHDLDRAISLLKTLPTEAERERAAVYMDGLAQMRTEWQGTRPRVQPASPTRARRRVRR